MPRLWGPKPCGQGLVSGSWVWIPEARIMPEGIPLSDESIPEFLFVKSGGQLSEG